MIRFLPVLPCFPCRLVSSLVDLFLQDCEFGGKGPCLTEFCVPKVRDQCTEVLHWLAQDYLSEGTTWSQFYIQEPSLTLPGKPAEQAGNWTLWQQWRAFQGKQLPLSFSKTLSRVSPCCTASFVEGHGGLPPPEGLLRGLLGTCSAQGPGGERQHHFSDRPRRKNIYSCSLCKMKGTRWALLYLFA